MYAHDATACLLRTAQQQHFATWQRIRSHAQLLTSGLTSNIARTMTLETCFLYIFHVCRLETIIYKHAESEAGTAEKLVQAKHSPAKSGKK